MLGIKLPNSCLSPTYAKTKNNHIKVFSRLGSCQENTSCLDIYLAPRNSSQKRKSWQIILAERPRQRNVVMSSEITSRGYLIREFNENVNDLNHKYECLLSVAVTYTNIKKKCESNLFSNIKMSSAARDIMRSDFPPQI